MDFSVYPFTDILKGSARVEYIGNYYNDPYIRGFLRDNFLRPSCYSCQYCNIRRCSDFTIADWWGYQAEPGELSDFEKKGVSLIMCNSAKAWICLRRLNSQWCYAKGLLRRQNALICHYLAICKAVHTRFILEGL